MNDQTSQAPTTCTDAEPFALRVLDDSMEPEFPQHCIIIVDPTGRATHNAFVVARADDKQGATDTPLSDESDVVFRQLQTASDTTHDYHLVPLNGDYPTVPLTGGTNAVIGVVTQRAGKRRRDHKRYDL